MARIQELARSTFQHMINNKHPILDSDEQAFEHAYWSIHQRYKLRDWAIGFDFFEYTRVIDKRDKENEFVFSEWLEFHEFILEETPIKPPSKFLLIKPTEPLPKESPGEKICRQLNDHFKRPVPREFEQEILTATKEDIHNILIRTVAKYMPDFRKRQTEYYQETDYVLLLVREFQLTYDDYQELKKNWDTYAKDFVKVEIENSHFQKKRVAHMRKIEHLQSICERWFMNLDLPPKFDVLPLLSIDEFLTSILPAKSQEDAKKSVTFLTEYDVEAVYSFKQLMNVDDWRTTLKLDLIMSNIDTTDLSPTIPYRLCDVLRRCTLLPQPNVPYRKINTKFVETRDPQEILTEIRNYLEAFYNRRIRTRADWQFTPNEDTATDTELGFDRVRGIIEHVHENLVSITESSARTSEPTIEEETEARQYCYTLWTTNQRKIAKNARMLKKNRENPYVAYALEKWNWIQRFNSWRIQLNQ